MKLYTFLILTAILCGIGCFNASNKNTHSQVIYEHVFSVTLPIPEPNVYCVSCHAVENSNGEQLACAFIDNNLKKGMVGLYDINTGLLIKKIYYPQMHNQVFIALKYVNRDSIFVFCESAYSSNGVQDSTFFMGNDKGNVIKVYPFESESVILQTRKKYKKETDSLGSLTYAIHSDAIPISSHGDVYFHYRKFGFLGTENRKKYRNTPSVCSYNLKTEKIAFIPIKYPSYVFDYNWYSDSYEIGIIGLGLDESPIMSYGFSSNIYSFEDGKVKEYYCPTHLFDSIKPIPSNKIVKPSTLYNEQGRYNWTYTDFYKKQYYRFLGLPVDTTASLSEQGKERFGMMILDSNFQVLGESEYANNVKGEPLCVSQKGLIFYRERNITVLTDSMHLDFYQFSFVNEPQITPTNANSKNKMGNKEDYNIMLKALIPEATVKQKSLIVTIPIGKSCGPCVDFTLQTVNKMLKQSPNLPIYVLFLGDEKEQTKSYLKSKNLGDIPHYRACYNGEYKNYIKKFHNPKIIEWQNGKIVATLQEEPDNLMEVSNKIQEFKE